TGYKAVAESALAVVEEALAADHYDAATRLLKIAETALPKTTSLSLGILVKARAKEVESWRTEYEGLRPAAEKLAQTPTDPEANLVVGKFQCLVKGHWSRGLPLLVLGGDARLKELARKDLAAPAEPDGQVEVGDGWWDLAETENGMANKRLQGRAYSWYQRAEPRLVGLTRTRVEERIKQTFQKSPDLETVGLIHAFRGYKGNLTGVAIAPDGRRAL